MTTRRRYALLDAPEWVIVATIAGLFSAAAALLAAARRLSRPGADSG